MLTRYTSRVGVTITGSDLWSLVFNFSFAMLSSATHHCKPVHVICHYGLESLFFFRISGFGFDFGLGLGLGYLVLGISWAASRCTRESHTRNSYPRTVPNHCHFLTLQHHGSIVDRSSDDQIRFKLPENISIISGVICFFRPSGIFASLLAFLSGDGLAEEDETVLMEDGGAKAGTLAFMDLLTWVILIIGAGAAAGAGVRGDEVVTVDGDVETLGSDPGPLPGGGGNEAPCWACWVISRGENLLSKTPLPMPEVPQTLPLLAEGHTLVEVVAWAGGVDARRKPCAGFSCLIEEWVVGVVGVMEDEAVLRKGSSDSGLTSLTADFLFLVGVLGTSKKDV
jgi:hypothetical protein